MLKGIRRNGMVHRRLHAKWRLPVNLPKIAWKEFGLQVRLRMHVYCGNPKGTTPAPRSTPIGPSCRIFQPPQNRQPGGGGPQAPPFRQGPTTYTDADLKKFRQAFTDWDRAFFSLLLATGLRRGEMQTV